MCGEWSEHHLSLPLRDQMSPRLMSNRRSPAHGLKTTSPHCDNPPRKIPYYHLNQTTLVN
jgi:hypothetical protein